MPLYEEYLINPLAVRFSQDRIWPDFQDGNSIEDTLPQISAVQIKSAPYDAVLRPPFPPMEIIRLKPERREADGEKIRDEHGQKQYGEESWFTFDNRRLYCLQRAALQRWPMATAVVVKVLFDFPAVRCARHKFRTTSDGATVKISLPDGSPGTIWNWVQVAQQAVTPRAAQDAAFAAVQRDMAKSSKDMLAEVPSAALLAPGDRESTVAERFNLGGARKEGKAAGMQLLNILQGRPEEEGGGVALFGQASPAPAYQAPAAHETSWEASLWQEDTYGSSNGWHERGGGKAHPKTSGKGSGWQATYSQWDSWSGWSGTSSYSESTGKGQRRRKGG